jgi:hypothetical protein
MVHSLTLFHYTNHWDPTKLSLSVYRFMEGLTLLPSVPTVSQATPPISGAHLYHWNYLDRQKKAQNEDG